MKKLLASVSFAALTILSFAQKAPFKFGEIRLEDLKMTSYTPDSAAAAVVLYDYGECVVTGDAYFRRHTIIKILKKDGYKWADVLVPVFGSTKGNISGFKASTYNVVNGKIEETKLEGDGKFRDEFVDGLEVMRFAMPNVKEGSILEYTYKIHNAGLRDWEFQTLIPVKYSEYKVYAHDNVKYNVFMQGYLSPEFFEKGYEYKGPTQLIKQHWKMENIPAFKPEPYISSYKNYVSKVNFALASITYTGYGTIDVSSSWEKFREVYRRSQFSSSKIKDSGFLNRITEKVIRNCKTNTEKAIAIFQFVKRQMEWNGINRNAVFGTLKDAYDKKQGDSAEINMLLLAMLQYAEIVANPVLLSTRENGIVRTEVTDPGQFNKVIAWADLDGKAFLFDATDRLLSHNFLSENCLNGLGAGYRVGESYGDWVSLSDPTRTKTAFKATLKLSDDGSVSGNLSVAKNGYAARHVREKIKRNQQDEYLRTLISENVEIQRKSFEEADTLNSQVIESHEITLANYGDVGRDIIYLNPILVSRIEENPFKSETREYPVDFGFSNEVTYSVKISIPDNFEVEYIPKQAISLLPNGAGKFIYSCVRSDREITLTTQFILSRSFFTQDEYPVLREFYSIVSAKHAERIVLKKK